MGLESHASHVLIRGHVFTYADKAPFVQSGVSVLGAIEYDKERDVVRCHECGEWLKEVSSRHLQGHRASTKSYRIRHGLKSRASLSAPSVKAKRSQKFRGTISNESFKSARLEGVSGSLQYSKSRTTKKLKVTNESENEVGRCCAQTLFRMQLLAAELGRTPTCDEVFAAGINAPTLHKHFGGYAQAIEKAGLAPRQPGNSVKRCPAPLPAGFPSKEKLMDTRMPWPKEYFGTGLPRSRSPLVA